MKILIISTPIGFIGSGVGGRVETYIKQTTIELIKLGWEVDIIAPENSKWNNSICKPKNLFIINGKQPINVIYADIDSPYIEVEDGILSKMLNYANTIQKNYDFILNNSYDWLSYWITDFFITPIIHIIHMKYTTNIMKNIIGEISKKKPQNLIFNSNFTFESYSLSITPNIIYPHINSYLYDYNHNPSNKYLGFVGRISPEKGIENALTVAQKTGKKLIVWGIIQDNEYKKNIMTKDNQNTIIWKDYINNEMLGKQLGKLYALLILGNWEESFGYAAIEANACGVPVICFNKGGTKEAIINNSTGYVVSNLEEAVICVDKIDKIDRKCCRENVLSKFSENTINNIQNYLLQYKKNY
jgi:UDP-glucose:tetrahydrobiopterin glucosyltransferase